MSATINHPAIRDNLEECDDFLGYIHKAGYHIELSTRGRHVCATLVGAWRVYPANSEGPETYCDMEGFSDTKRGAVEELALACSGRQVATQLEYRWFRNQAIGPLKTFPRFVATGGDQA